jgi:hypothetical protein
MQQVDVGVEEMLHSIGHQKNIENDSFSLLVEQEGQGAKLLGVKLKKPILDIPASFFDEVG